MITYVPVKTEVSQALFQWQKWIPQMAVNNSNWNNYAHENNLKFIPVNFKILLVLFSDFESGSIQSHRWEGTVRSCARWLFQWHRVSVQCGLVSFRGAAKWLSYSHIYIIFILFSIVVYYRVFNVAPCPIYSRTLLLIHPICNSLYLLIPNSQPILPHPRSLLVTTNLFSVCDSISISEMGSFVPYFRFHI